jgi:hypothetical protein
VRALRAQSLTSPRTALSAKSDMQLIPEFAFNISRT